MVLVHDNDLVQIDGIHGSEDTVGRSLYCQPIVLTFSCLQPLESLQLDALLSHLRIAKPKTYSIPFFLGEFVIESPGFLFLTEALTQKICRPLTSVRVVPRNSFGWLPSQLFWAWRVSFSSCESNLVICD
jgi:hypothetical protein